MKNDEWDKFVIARNKFRCLISEFEKDFPKVQVVYNKALYEVTIESNIKLILVGDNPGKKEAEQGRYLVGPSGKIAAKFFCDNPELKIDFYKHVLILNKIPVHTPRTNQLKDIVKINDPALSSAFKLLQKKMAHLLLEFQTALSVPVYITGYSEMKKHGIFESYTEELKKIYSNKPELLKQLFIYRHFSMNQFTIDLKKQILPGESVSKSLKRIGTAYRKKIFCPRISHDY